MSDTCVQNFRMYVSRALDMETKKKSVHFTDTRLVFVFTALNMNANYAQLRVGDTILYRYMEEAEILNIECHPSDRCQHSKAAEMAFTLRILKTGNVVHTEPRFMSSVPIRTCIEH